MPDQPKTPQFNVRMEEQDRLDAIAIARANKERDALGSGLSVVVRKAVKNYIARNRETLERVRAEEAAAKKG